VRTPNVIWSTMPHQSHQPRRPLRNARQTALQRLRPTHVQARPRLGLLRLSSRPLLDLR
jgi:hypothetical protein